MHSAMGYPMMGTAMLKCHGFVHSDLPQGTDDGNESAFSIYRKWPLSTYAHG